MALADYITNAMAPQALPTQPLNGAQQVLGTLEQIVGSGSSYIQNARRRGMETAATRGGINSSIAAGASERAALESAMPLVQQANQIDQTGINAQYDNWLAQQNFGRALYGQQFSSSLDMLNYLQQAAVNDPELYTPEITSGLSNFFQKNTQDILNRYFGA